MQSPDTDSSLQSLGFQCPIDKVGQTDRQTQQNIYKMRLKKTGLHRKVIKGLFLNNPVPLFYPERKIYKRILADLKFSKLQIFFFPPGVIVEGSFTDPDVMSLDTETRRTLDCS